MQTSIERPIMTEVLNLPEISVVARTASSRYNTNGFFHGQTDA
jgi:hypothetical protein